ncbi:TIGR01777 family oxidoreductase [Paenibacillus sediminis]|uniref:Uncharacterized protein (TIGR01777 family) n=1 Tax=Paenibacillus sediminis TaxID=664909 RepID=A0ABS4H4I4_9BACL|nr:TIGR01777 family oxidoreductase [Paenibacillus sediminis]MBP1937440.1 uncharacterized protein (TIGR01777 family) [Paenibacillus sediminis]
MRIAICGGTGFVGKALVEYWLKEGHELMVITRKVTKHNSNIDGITYVTWQRAEKDPHAFEGVEAIVNLAGETINQRWSAKAKERIMQSRLQTVSAVAKLVQSLKHKPKVVVQASAMSIYGTSWTETFDETSSEHIMNFPAEVAKALEDETKRIKDTRVIRLRVSLVLGNEGGAFPLMKLPYLLGVGGRIGSGKQWTSWIHIQDIVRLIDFCLKNEDISGPVNASSPHPVTNDQFGKIVGQVYRRPHWFPIPSFMFKILFGEMSTILLEGQRVVPRVALEHGFKFLYPTLEEALSHLKNEGKLK